MFKVTIDDVEYEVKFQHFLPHKDSKFLDPNVFRASFGTRCEISCENEVVAYSASDISPKDNFNRNTGRKVSLTKALKNLFPDNPEKRELFWNQYWLTRGGKW